MTEKLSRDRQKAEEAFARTQGPARPRSRAEEELDQIVQARAEKTQRLKQARLDREAADRAAGPTAPRPAASAGARLAPITTAPGAARKAPPRKPGKA
ncbi:hypothetical protein [Pannonibacter tanglangensis]|uniref:hypothetical protein n=1 Tax=Pannonibacter tanglangensis TaxID=2750084 RepID=UPI0015D1DCA3|nr:hypothetical protein [Pannonibacter sp. XCT-53]